MDLEFIRSLKKAELHAHLYGSLPPHFLLDFARKRGVLSSEEFAALQVPPKNWDACFRLFDLVYKAVRYHPEDIYACTRAAIEQFMHDGVSYLELRTSLKESSEFDLSWDLYLDTILRATDDFLTVHGKKIQVRWIVSVDRSKGVDCMRKSLETILQHQKKSSYIVGIDLCGDPYVGHFNDFVHLFQKAREEGLKTTAHFAEVPRFEDLCEILDFKPDRLGHACSLNRALFDTILEKEIPVEICFSSNLSTGVVCDPNVHIVRAYHKATHAIAICTDDHGIFHSRINEEYLKISKLLDLPKAELESLAQNSFRYAFCSAYQNFGSEIK